LHTNTSLTAAGYFKNAQSFVHFSRHRYPWPAALKTTPRISQDARLLHHGVREKTGSWLIAMFSLLNRMKHETLPVAITTKAGILPRLTQGQIY
jgi:hypothetical protein